MESSLTQVRYRKVAVYEVFYPCFRNVREEAKTSIFRGSVFSSKRIRYREPAARTKLSVSIGMPSRNAAFLSRKACFRAVCGVREKLRGQLFCVQGSIMRSVRCRNRWGLSDFGLRGVSGETSPAKRQRTSMKLHPPFNARDVKASVDLVPFIRQFTRLRRTGRQFIGLCPLHSERHPSFFVHQEKQVFKCFGCGAGGDVFEFAMRIAGCDFRRALKIVAEFSEGVGRENEPRSGERFRADVGAKPLSPPQAGALFSQPNRCARARILAALQATNRRLRAIESSNSETSAELATSCEPERGVCC
jgi:hypothetical protein